MDIGPNTFTSYGDNDIFVAKCSPILLGVEPRIKPSEQLVIYANPNEGKCTITLPEEFMNENNLTLSIFNSQGKLIQKVPIENFEGKISLNIQSEAKGMYNVILTNGRKNYSGKIIFN